MSVNYLKAKKIAEEYIEKHQIPENQRIDGNKFVLIEEEIIEKTYGWYFFWAPSKWIETQNIKYMYLGGGPFLVKKSSGQLVEFSSAYSIEEIVENYENERTI